MAAAARRQSKVDTTTVTLSLAGVVLGMLLVVLWVLWRPAAAAAPTIISQTTYTGGGGRGTAVDLGRGGILTDPYVPPIRSPGVWLLPTAYTQPVQVNFEQVGILTNNGSILPLMGRRVNRDKWQYYTLADTGGIHSKLLLRSGGRDAMCEYGIDELDTHDTVVVDGYNHPYVVSKYPGGGLLF
jgi:hypothetical protein